MYALLVTLVLSPPTGPWRAVLDLAGGPLRFTVNLEQAGGKSQGTICNGPQCQPLSAVQVNGDSVVFEIAAYAATISAVSRGDSLIGEYHNLGRRYHLAQGVRFDPWVGAGLAPFPFVPSAAAGRWRPPRPGWREPGMRSF